MKRVFLAAVAASILAGLAQRFGARAVLGRWARSLGLGPKLDELTKDELYERAQEADVSGRSTMTKKELAKAVDEG
jgi:hypothetical protein